MKRILFSLCVLAIGISAFAQLPTQAEINKDYHLFANPNTYSEYHWSVSGGSTSDFSGTTSSVVVNWNSGTLGNIYSLTVYAVNDGCAGDDKVKQFILVDKLSYNGSFVKGYNACPINTKNHTSAGAFDIKVNIVTGAPLAVTDNVTISFTLDGVPQPSQTANPDGNGVVKVNVPLTGATGTNNTSANVVKNIVVTGIAISGRNPVAIPDADRPTGTFELKFNPVIDDIN